MLVTPRSHSPIWPPTFSPQTVTPTVLSSTTYQHHCCNPTSPSTAGLHCGTIPAPPQGPCPPTAYYHRQGLSEPTPSLRSTSTASHKTPTTITSTTCARSLGTATIDHVTTPGLIPAPYVPLQHLPNLAIPQAKKTQLLNHPTHPTSLPFPPLQTVDSRPPLPAQREKTGADSSTIFPLVRFPR